MSDPLIHTALTWSVDDVTRTLDEVKSTEWVDFELTDEEKEEILEDAINSVEDLLIETINSELYSMVYQKYLEKSKE
jgi:UDP-galactopyranose mutase